MKLIDTYKGIAYLSTENEQEELSESLKQMNNLEILVKFKEDKNIRKIVPISNEYRLKPEGKDGAHFYGTVGMLIFYEKKMKGGQTK